MPPHHFANSESDSDSIEVERHLTIESVTKQQLQLLQQKQHVLHSSMIGNKEHEDNRLCRDAVRRVSFYPKVKVRRHLHRADYTMKEARATWYTETEYSLMKKECITTVRMMMDDKYPFVDTDRYTSRGLEYRTPRGMHIRHEHKIHALETVLHEQYIQWEHGVNDPEHLAEVCCKCARQSINLAHVAAVRDEEFVLDDEAN